MKNSIKTNTCVIAAASAATLLCNAHARAQAYPAKPLRIIVSSSPGGGSDFIGRFLAQKLSEAVGQQVIVENRAGAGGSLGIEAGIRAVPDGYTFNVITPSYAVNPNLYPFKFDPANDFTAVAPIARGPLVASIHPSVPAKTLRGLIVLAKARPGEIVYGTAGQGTLVHLSSALFLHGAGIKMVHVPYKGGGPALTDLIAGQISMVFATPQTALPQAKAGRIRTLAVTTATRIAAEPNIPTIAESGVPGYDVSNWHGLIGPKGLPRAVVERINSEVNKIVRSKETEERLRSDGVSPTGGTAEALQEQVRREIVMWRDAVKVAGIKIQ